MREGGRVCGGGGVSGASIGIIVPRVQAWT